MRVKKTLEKKRVTLIRLISKVEDKMSDNEPV